ncbi:MAG: PAS domain S-box protein [Syntrophobacteraceae bacterium]
MDEYGDQIFCEGERDGTLAEKGGGCRPGVSDLVEEKARLRAILDTTVDGIVTIDERAIIQSFNKAAEKIFGYRAREVIGRNVSILQPSPYREHHDEYVARYLETGIRKIIGIGREVEGMRKDGAVFPLYLAVSEVLVGEKRFFTGIVKDLSEQKAAMREIESLARFPEENPHPVLRFSREGRLLYANSASDCILETWGCKRGGAIPHPWRETILETLQSGKKRDIEVRCHSRIFDLTLVPTRAARDINGFGRDVTERRMAEDSLRASEEKHRALIESSTDAIFVADVERRILSFNPAFLELFGLRADDALGKTTRILHPTDESYEEFGRTFMPVVRATGCYRTEWKLARKDGTIISTEETISAIREHDGSPVSYVVIIRDITERKQAEEELKAYRDHLEEMVAMRTKELEDAYKSMLQEEKLKTLGTLSAEMAHEFRNPLMSLGGFARRLSKRLPDDGEVAIIVKESARLETILKRIEDYLRPVEMRPRKCSVNAIIVEAVALLSPELDGESVKLAMSLGESIPPAYVDPAVLIQVIVNVIHNAANVMRRDGKVEIETFESDQHVHIVVRAPLRSKIKDPEHVFIPFGETRGEVSVPICFKLLRGMGGELVLAQEDDVVVFSASLLKASERDGQ